MSDEELAELKLRAESESVSPQDVAQLITAVEELQFKVWYYSRRLDAWSSKAMALEHLLKNEEHRVTGYTLIQIEYEDGKFHQVCDEVNERLKEWYREHHSETYEAIMGKYRSNEGGDDDTRTGL